MSIVPLALVAAALAQPAGSIVPLWDGKAPHAVGDSAADKPNLTVHLAPKDKATGTAVVICPGGGYGFLADDHEGKQVAEFLNGLGVHAFVLQVPDRREGPPRPARPGPAGRTPSGRSGSSGRRRPDYGIDPNRVGI